MVDDLESAKIRLGDSQFRSCAPLVKGVVLHDHNICLGTKFRFYRPFQDTLTLLKADGLDYIIILIKIRRQAFRFKGLSPTRDARPTSIAECPRPRNSR